MNSQFDSNGNPIGVTVSGSNSKYLLFIGAAIIIYLIAKQKG